MVTGLAVPWGIAFLPDGTALVGERDTGRLLRVSDGSADVVGTLDVRSRVDEGGETGLLGLALHPAFETNRLLYVYLSTDDDNRIVRMTYDGTLGKPDPILTGIGTSTHHNGGGLAFGPDGLLYAATGDAENSASAQDTGSVDGKVLRMTDAGGVPDGNPFDNLTWSFGHRNVEGISLRRHRPAVGLGVRRQGRRRAQPDPAGQELRLARRRGLRRQGRVRRPARRVAGRPVLAERHRDRRRPGLARRAAGRVRLVRRAGRRGRREDRSSTSRASTAGSARSPSPPTGRCG